jgi:hypothetical protein
VARLCAGPRRKPARELLESHRQAIHRPAAYMV